MQIRVARPTRDLDAARRFYGDALGLPVVASFDDHEGYSGVVFGLPDASRQLELVAHEAEEPSPTDEDQLVLYLGSTGELEAKTSRLRVAGFESRVPANPYWERTGAVAFIDPDGYWLILSPDAWAEAR